MVRLADEDFDEATLNHGDGRLMSYEQMKVIAIDKMAKCRFVIKTTKNKK